jgi:hypothetical protein
VWIAEAGTFEFELRATHNAGYRLRRGEIRPEDSPLLCWECDDHGSDEAKARAERLANRHVRAIIR